jgi:hypothetical protein
MIYYFLASLILSFIAIQIYIRKWIVERNLTAFHATQPCCLKPHRKMLRYLAPGLYPHTLQWSVHREQFRIGVFIARQLWHGASNPAIVVHENPTIIAAYGHDCDAVLLVRFLPETLDDLKERSLVLRLGTRLLSVNTYFMQGQEWKNDEIVLGPERDSPWSPWSSFRPYIAEFMCSDIETIERRKREIPEELWARTKQLGLQKVQTSNLNEVRWGNPVEVEVPRSYRQAREWAEYWGIEA